MMPLRDDIAKAIIKGFEEDVRPGEAESMAFDPDTCWRAADEVVAMLMSKLTGQLFEAEFSKHVIGAARFVTDGQVYD